MQKFMRLRQERDVVVIKNEVDKYLVDASEDPSNKNFELLQWWKENTHRYPILSKIAKDVFAVPASTVASETAFSLGARVVDPFRASLTPKMVEALVCANDWLKADGFSFYKDPAKDEIELYEELENVEKGVENDTATLNFLLLLAGYVYIKTVMQYFEDLKFAVVDGILVWYTRAGSKI